MEFHQAALHSLRELYDTITPRTSILRKLNRGCLLCRKRCRTKAGEAAHMFRAHGIIARRRTLTDTPCPACLKNYHTMDKVSAHLYYSSRCRRTLQSRNYACIAVPGAGSLEDRQRQQEHDRLLPPIQAAGPLYRSRNDFEKILASAASCTCSSWRPASMLPLHRKRLRVWQQRKRMRDIYLMDDVDCDAALLRGQPGGSGRGQVGDGRRWSAHSRNFWIQRDAWGLKAPFAKEVTSLEELEKECGDVAVTEWLGHAPIRIHAALGAIESYYTCSLGAGDREMCSSFWTAWTHPRDTFCTLYGHCHRRAVGQCKRCKGPRVYGSQRRMQDTLPVS